MAIIHKLTKIIKRKNSSVDPRLLICVECGSDQVTIRGKNLWCKNCGIKRKFKKTKGNVSFSSVLNEVLRKRLVKK